MPTPRLISQIQEPMDTLPKVPNKQAFTAGIFWVLALLFAGLMTLPFLAGAPLSGAWALAFISIFLMVSSVVTALIFTSRARKMARLLSSDTLLARWELDDEMLRVYVSLQNEENAAKNKAVMWIVGFFFAAITLLFLFFLDKEEMGGFALIMGAIFLLVFGASRFFPWYYRRRNLKADRQILIGGKYAYINGYFHNWDYPLSGLTKVAILRKPFYGLHLAYYYTDRTLRNTHELKIPASADLDLQSLMEQIRSVN